MENFYHRKPYTNGNWGPIVTKAYMAAAILWDNEEMYNKAVDFYLHANDNGTIANIGPKRMDYERVVSMLE